MKGQRKTKVLQWQLLRHEQEAAKCYRNEIVKRDREILRLQRTIIDLHLEMQLMRQMNKAVLS